MSVGRPDDVDAVGSFSLDAVSGVLGSKTSILNAVPADNCFSDATSCYCGNASPSFSSDINYHVSLFEHLFRSQQPNHKCCRIPILSSKLKITVWRNRLVGYPDYAICDLLEFGFPLDFQGTYLDYSARRNHKGARDHASYISAYLKKECTAGRMAGPFCAEPLSVLLMVSPLNTVPKDDPNERRVIVDLSWPHGASVNDGISKEFYLDEVIDLRYASVADVCHMVMEIGPGALIYKRDLRHAYRQIPVDPRDYCYLGYHWEDTFYFDTVLVMGQRNAGMACARTTNAVVYMHQTDGHQATNYLDDLIGVAPTSSADIAFHDLGVLLCDLGLEENKSKACPPSTCQTVLGVDIDTVAQTISVTSARLAEISALVKFWLGKQTATKTELRSLCGKLLYVSKCVRQSRTFLNRVLQVLRSFPPDLTRVTLTDSFRKDIVWWNRFLEQFNGVSFIPPLFWQEPDVIFSTDSTLDGCGGISDKQYFHSSFPAFLKEQDLPIHKLELLTVIVAVRLWGPRCRGMKVVIYCDNEPAVSVINTGKSRDPFMATCIRELWLVVASNLFELRAIHLPGVDNRVADALSRWDESVFYRDSFFSFTSDSVYDEVYVVDDLFRFSDDL